MKPNEKLLAEEAFFYQLWETETGALRLEVIGNHSAFYFISEHLLTDAEVAKYRKGGKRYLTQLANKHMNSGVKFKQ